MNPYKPKVKAPNPFLVDHTKEILEKHRLSTICEAASCPNRTECYFNKTATFMILGDICTRACAFCHVQTGKGLAVERDEPYRLAQAIRDLKLEYVVITSVDRDDLKDYGAGHFLSCVTVIKEECPLVKIELLTPDFHADERAMELIVQTRVNKLAHNQETVRRLSPSIRPQSRYERSLKTLQFYASKSQSLVKSSLMLGLGETKSELLETMQDLLDVGVSELTLGQYLQPTKQHHKVEKYYPQEFFDEIRSEAISMGFKAVASGILVRSSYHAKEL